MPQITIQPHPATLIVEGIPVRGCLDQQQVMVDGKRVAYCGVKPGMAVSFIRPYPQAFKDLVVAHVEAALGGPAAVVAEVPPLAKIKEAKKSK